MGILTEKSPFRMAVRTASSWSVSSASEVLAATPPPNRRFDLRPLLVDCSVGMKAPERYLWTETNQIGMARRYSAVRQITPCGKRPRSGSTLDLALAWATLQRVHMNNRVVCGRPAGRSLHRMD